MAGSNLVQALDRGLDLVERLADAPDGLTLAALAEALGISSPATHNLLRTLAARGWVERRERPVRYAVGPRLGELAARRTGYDLRRRVERALDGLARRQPETQWIYAEYLDDEIVGTLLAAAHSGCVVERRGSPLGPYASASGLTYQAWCTPAERAHLRAVHDFAEFGAGLWRDVATLDAFLAAARAAGHVAPPKPEGSVRVGVPVLGADGRLRGMIGGHWPCAPAQHEMQAARVAAELRLALLEIHQPPPPPIGD